MARAAELLDELRASGLSDAADYIETTGRCGEARRVMARAALNTKGEPIRAAYTAFEDWRTSPADPGDLSGAFDREHARPARMPV